MSLLGLWIQRLWNALTNEEDLINLNFDGIEINFSL